MTKFKNVKIQWGVSYILILLIPTIIFMSAFAIENINVRKDVFNANNMLLNEVLKELDSSVQSLKMTYSKLEYDVNLRKMIFSKGERRENLFEYATAVLTRTKESILYEDIKKQVFIALPNIDIALCSNSGISDIDTVMSVVFHDMDYSQLLQLIAENEYGAFVPIKISEGSLDKEVLAYIGKLPMKADSNNYGLVVVWMDLEYIFGENGILGNYKNHEVLLLNENRMPVFSKQKDFPLDIPEENKGVYEKNGNLISFAKLNATDWYLFLSTPRAEFFKRLFALNILTYIGLLISLISGIIICIYLIKRNYKPMQQLIERVVPKSNKAVGRQNINAYEVLNDNFSQMINKINLAEKNIEKQGKKLWDTYLARLLTGQYCPELLENIENVPEFISDRFMVLIISVESYEELFQNEDMTLEERFRTSQIIVTNIMEEIINEENECFIVPYKKWLGAIISLNPEITDAPRIIYDAVEKGNKIIYEHFKLSVSVGASGVHNNYYGIYECCREAEGALEQACQIEDNVILHHNTSAVVHSDYYYQTDNESKLINAVAVGDYDTAKGIVVELFLNNPAVKDVIMHKHKCVLLRIIGALMRISGDAMDSRSLSRLLETELSWSETEKKLLEIIKQACDSYSNISIKELTLAEKVKRYVEENFCDNNLSIKLLGSYFNLSPYYLSRLFKEEFGIAFGDYLRKKRIECAKEMMENNVSITLNEVALKVGFTDSRALKRAFMQEVGVLPSDYITKIKN